MGPTGPQGYCPMRGPSQVRAGPPTWLRARWKAPSVDHSTRKLRLGLATTPSQNGHPRQVGTGLGPAGRRDFLRGLQPARMGTTRTPFVRASTYCA